MKYSRFYRYLLPVWKKEALVLLLSGLGALLGLVNPYLAKLIIDNAYKNRNLKLFIVLVVSGGAIFILSAVNEGLINYLNRYIRMRVNLDLNRKIFAKLRLLPYGFYQDSSTGENLYKINYDVDVVTQFIVIALPQIVYIIPKALLILIIVFSLNWKMAVVALGFMPVFFLVPYYFNRRINKGLKSWVEKSQGIFKQLQEVLAHIKFVKASGREHYESRQYIASLITRIRMSLKNIRLEMTGLFANNISNRLIVGVIAFYGGYQLIKGEMTLGVLGAITVYLNQLSALQNSFAQFFQQLALGKVSCERLGNILDFELPTIGPQKKDLEIIFPRGSIDFENALFGYRKEKKILNNLTFSFPARSVIALAGPSGCGKTTIISLMLRLYSLEGGRILIDGHDISRIKSGSFYPQIGVVFQEPHLWNDTVRNNINYYNKKIGFEAIRRAARLACIDEFLQGLPQGYDTFIGERACKVSEGQKQRIAIARAIAKSPKILILDEAFSSIDAQTEEKITDNIISAFADNTVIIISHRLSTISKIGSVYFLDNGGNLDIGAHDELLRRNTAYRNYLASQLEKTTLTPC